MASFYLRERARLFLSSLFYRYSSQTIFGTVAGPGTGAMATAPPPPPALCRGVAEAIAGGSWQAATATGMTDRWNKIAILDGPGCPQADLYEWLPSSCRLERRARKSFCGRHIAFIGASLLEQSFTSLSLMLKSLPGIRCQTRKVLGAWVESFECVAGNATCSITLSYVLSRFLCFDDCQRTEYRDTGTGPHHVGVHVSLNELESLSPALSPFPIRGADLVFGTGPWWTSSHPNMDIGQRAVHAILQANTRKCFQLATLLNASSIHFRTLWPGHQGCGQYKDKGPLTSVPVLRPPAPYGWDEVLPINRLIARECSAEPSCVIHDLEDMSALSPDAHSSWRNNWRGQTANSTNPWANPNLDCLHWCSFGGPIEWANVILHNQLSSMQSVDDSSVHSSRSPAWQPAWE